MKEKVVRLKVAGLNKLFEQFKGSRLSIKNAVPEPGWIRVEIEGRGIHYDFMLSESRSKRIAPVVVKEETLPDTMSVLTETVRVINQLKYIGYPVSLITFDIGAPGIPVMSNYEGIEQRIDFKKPTPVRGKNS